MISPALQYHHDISYLLTLNIRRWVLTSSDIYVILIVLL